MPVVWVHEVPEKVEALRAGVRRRWERHPDATRFLAGHYSAAWERIRLCRMQYRTYESPSFPDQVKLTPYCCNIQPWCLECMGFAHWRRTQRVLDKFRMCTPRGEESRFMHIVITAPYHDGASSWGREASRNIKAFAKVVAGSLTEVFGEGIGGVMSYQDFGEAGFAKRHPHMDLTLNGWTIKDGKAHELAYYDLNEDGGEGYGRFVAVVEKHAKALRLEAEGTNLYLGQVVEGVAAYHKVLAYQLRELVDIRKIEYAQADQVIGWINYKDHTTTDLPVTRFMLGFEEYCARLRVHDGKAGANLHRAFGHMADRTIRSTMMAVGGRPEPHAEGCPCNVCSEWRRIFIDDIDCDAGWLGVDAAV